MEKIIKKSKKLTTFFNKIKKIRLLSKIQKNNNVWKFLKKKKYFNFLKEKNDWNFIKSNNQNIQKETVFYRNLNKFKVFKKNTYYIRNRKLSNENVSKFYYRLKSGIWKVTKFHYSILSKFLEYVKCISFYQII